MPQHQLPPDYAVIQLADQRWYPVRVDVYYAADTPEEGYRTLYLLHDIDGKVPGYQHQHEAVEECQKHAEADAYWERHNWEVMAIKSDVYPERCIHYQEEIAAITGHLPSVQRRSHDVQVYVFSQYCRFCLTEHPWFFTTAFTIEDALEQAAQQAYASRCACMRAQEERAQLLAEEREPVVGGCP